MFKCTKGPKSDVSEFEYVASLHQTSFKLRCDCSVSSEDVRLYLMSRYGIKASRDQIMDIVMGLGAGKNNSTKTTTLLLIPQGGDDGKDDEEKRKMTTRMLVVEEEATNKDKGEENHNDKKQQQQQQQEDEEEEILQILSLQRERIAATDDTRFLAGDELIDAAESQPRQQELQEEELPRQEQLLDDYPDPTSDEEEKNEDIAQEEFLDLIDWVSALLIPTFVKMKKNEPAMLVDASQFSPLDEGASNVLQRASGGPLSQNLQIDQTLTEELQQTVVGLEGLNPLSLVERIRTWYREQLVSAGNQSQVLLERELASIQDMQKVFILVYNILLQDLQERTHHNDTKNVNGILTQETLCQLLLFYEELPLKQSTLGNKDDSKGIDSNRWSTVCQTASSHRSFLQHIMGESATMTASPREVAGMNKHTASEPYNNPDILFDCNFFLNALSSDIMLWDDDLEKQVSTPYQDVFGLGSFKNSMSSHHAKTAESCSNIECNSPPSGIPDEQIQKENAKVVPSKISSGVVRGSSSTTNCIAATATRDKISGKEHDKKDKMKSFECIDMSPHIDAATDTQYSILFVMAVWIYFIYSVTVYMTFINASAYDVIECRQGGFQCTLVNRIWTWLILGIILTSGGIIIIIPISIANHPYHIGTTRASIAAGTTAVFTIVPYVAIQAYKHSAPHGDNGQFTDLDLTIQAKWFQLAMDTYMAYGTVILAVIIPKNAISDYLYNTSQILNYWLTSSDITRSAGIKMATNRKLHLLLNNALHVHKSAGDHFKTPSEAYLSHTDTIDETGGFFWSWAQYLSRQICTEHGIWIHSKLAVGMEGQIISFVFLIWILIVQTNKWADQAEITRARIVATEASSYTKDFALWYVPTGQTIQDSCTVGLAFASCAGVVLMLLYLPSTMATILKLRCGAIPSMHDPHFLCYRLSADTTYYNIGNMIYGFVGAQLLFFAFFGGITFLSLWPVTRSGFLRFLAWFTALMITITLKFIVTKILRKKFFRAFYRQRPRAANIYSIAYEAWHLGLGGGVLIGRLTQFLLASAFWIGRIDVTFLCRDVHILGYRFDTAPNNFRKEILVHEAHRHPYIDRLGQMYLMRLRHGRNFCSTAGCMWRRLFVLALMPWLKKYSMCNKEHCHETATS